MWLRTAGSDCRLAMGSTPLRSKTIAGVKGSSQDVAVPAAASRCRLTKRRASSTSIGKFNEGKRIIVLQIPNPGSRRDQCFLKCRFLVTYPDFYWLFTSWIIRNSVNITYLSCLLLVGHPGPRCPSVNSVPSLNIMHIMRAYTETARSAVLPHVAGRPDASILDAQGCRCNSIFRIDLG